MFGNIKNYWTVQKNIFLWECIRATSNFMVIFLKIAFYMIVVKHICHKFKIIILPVGVQLPTLISKSSLERY